MRFWHQKRIVRTRILLIVDNGKLKNPVEHYIILLKNMLTINFSKEVSDMHPFHRCLHKTIRMRRAKQGKNMAYTWFIETTRMRSTRTMRLCFHREALHNTA
jgi:hypothetical protein